MATSKRSTGLEGRENIYLDRPPWASAHEEAEDAVLSEVVAQAVDRPSSRKVTDLLMAVEAVRGGPSWPPPMDSLRERASAIRRETLQDLPGYVGRLVDATRSNGVTVHFASTPGDARQIITDIAKERGVELIVKSKSMVTEEIGLTKHLESVGIQSVETDLGEYIVQLADERPSHVMVPAIHRSKDDIARVFSELSGQPVSPDIPELVAFARQRLRDDFARADMGISGVNFAAADTGTLVIVTNEGNGRMVTSRPRVHVAVMTMEKVIPRFADLAVLLPLLFYAASRQRLTAYQTFIHGPRQSGENEGPEEVHLVILDNGRSDISRGVYKEVLACIRCGACQSACPVYRRVGGGQAYLSTYGGPIGAVLTPLLQERPGPAELSFLSTLCGACEEVCPVQIPLTNLLVELRADHEASKAPYGLSRLAWKAWGELWSSSYGYSISTATVRLIAPLIEQARQLGIPLPGALGRWTRSRSLPKFTTREQAKHSSATAAKFSSSARDASSNEQGPFPASREEHVDES